MRNPLVKIFIIVILFSIMSRELLSLPSPVATAKIFYTEKADITWVYIWLIFSFLLLPTTLAIHIILLQLKYHMIAPERAVRWFYDTMLLYLDSILTTVMCVLLIFYFLNVSDIVVYSMLRLGGTFPENPMSHMFQFISIVVSLHTTLIFFTIWILMVSFSVISRFSYLNNISGFLTKNWPLFTGSISGLVFYWINVLNLSFKIDKISTTTDISVYHIVNSSLGLIVLMYIGIFGF